VQRLYAVVFCVQKAIEGMSIILGLMANFVKNLFIEWAQGEHHFWIMILVVYHCTA